MKVVDLSQLHKSVCEVRDGLIDSTVDPHRFIGSQPNQPVSIYLPTDQ